MSTRKPAAKKSDQDDAALLETVSEDRPFIRVSAPGGMRRRANMEFGPTPTDLTEAQLGPDQKTRLQTLKALQGDPLLKIESPRGVAELDHLLNDIEPDPVDSEPTE